MFLTYFFLHLEARRFRYYEISRDRVQILCTAAASRLYPEGDDWHTDGGAP